MSNGLEHRELLDPYIIISKLGIPLNLSTSGGTEWQNVVHGDSSRKAPKLSLFDESSLITNEF